MGLIQVPPPPPSRTPDCDSQAALVACNNPNPPDWCDACNNLPIDGWIPILFVIGMLMGIYKTYKNGRIQQT